MSPHLRPEPQSLSDLQVQYFPIGISGVLQLLPLQQSELLLHGTLALQAGGAVLHLPVKVSQT